MFISFKLWHIFICIDDDLRLHRFSVNNLGNISVLLSTRYTVVLLFYASLSRCVLGLTKWLTSAICTPHSTIPFY